MLDKDPEFYQKWLSLCALTPVSPLKMSIIDNKVVVTLGTRVLGALTFFEWIHLPPGEILKRVGLEPRKDVITK